MSQIDDFDMEDWEPRQAEPNWDALRKHAFRPDKKAEERRAMCEPAYSRRFECPGCGIPKNLDPVFTGDEWHYIGQCSNCGTKWANAFLLQRKCEECGKKVPLTSRNPEGRCKCQGEIRRPF